MVGFSAGECHVTVASRKFYFLPHRLNGVKISTYSCWIEILVTFMAEPEILLGLGLGLNEEIIEGLSELG